MPQVIHCNTVFEDEPKSSVLSLTHTAQISKRTSSGVLLVNLKIASSVPGIPVGKSSAKIGGGGGKVGDPGPEP